MKYSFSWLTKKAHKSKLPLGYGIVAKENIEKGETVIIFGGYVMDRKHFNALPEKMQSYPFQVGESFFFGLSKLSEVENADYLNHSCDPNCGFGGEISVVAMRNIKKGEQITIDYAMCLSSRDIEDMDCKCGNKNCRKKITSDDWKIKFLQKKYEGYFEPYLKRKIDKIN